MLQWIKRYAAKRCRKLKQKRRQTVTEEVDSLNHIYEEIPDVIPANWRGVRSESVPSFFLLATADHSFGSDNMEDENSSMCSPRLTSFDQSYETPQNCLGYKIEDIRIDEVTSVDNNKVKNEQDLTELCNAIDTMECYHDRLSCVRVSCQNNHSVTINKLPRGEESETTDKTDRGRNCDEDLPSCSVLEPSWEKFCDDLVSSLVLKTSSFKQKYYRRHKDYSDVYFNSSEGNMLLGDLIQRNYDRVY